VQCTDSSCPGFEPTKFILSNLDDLNYLYTPTNPILVSSLLKESLMLRIEGLESMEDFKYLLVKNDNHSVKIRLEFMTSFKKKKLIISKKNPLDKLLAGRLLQEDSNSSQKTLLIDLNLNQINDLSAEIMIDSIDIKNLSLDPNQNDAPFRIIKPPKFISTFLESFIPLLLGLLGLSVFAIIISNFSIIHHEFTISLKYWFFSLFRLVILYSSLSLINKTFPEPLEYFFITLYSGVLGRDDFKIDPLNSFNYTVNQPQFYRLLRTDSLFSNNPLVLALHIISIILLLFFYILKSKNKLLKITTKFFKFFSANIVCILIFPFILDILINSILSLTHSQFNSSSGLFDFLLSLLYFLSFFLGNA
jgi:hypothetical protein